MKKWANMLAITVLIVFCLTQIYGLVVADVYDFATITFAEEFLDDFSKAGYSTQKGCQVLLLMGITNEEYLRRRNNYSLKALDIFAGVENECKEIIEFYKKEEKTKSLII